MKQASEKERREALEAQSRREDKQPYATELDDRDHEHAQEQEKDRPTKQPKQR